MSEQSEQSKRAKIKASLGAVCRKRTVLLVSGGLVIVLVFALGVGVGQGRIAFGGFASSQNASLPANLDYSTVNQVYQILRTDYDGKLTTNQLLDGLKAGLATSTGDPYTEYFNAKQASEFNDELQGSFSGVGAQLGQDASGNLEVIAPLAGSPATKAGLRAQDIITSINGKSTSGMAVDIAVNAIRGKKSTKVTLDIVRGGSQQITLTITRDNITVPSVNSQVLSGNIGYMQVNQFSDDTSGLATKAAQQFKQAGVKGIILDLRDNPGGEVDAAVNLSSLWLPQGDTVLQTKRGSTVVETDRATGNNVLQGIPTVVLVDGGTASAAEITAGALHDDKNVKATLIGQKTYGKGVVQEVKQLTAGAELKVTIASWYRPNGQNINHKGITPDKSVTLSDDDIKQGKDPQKDAAIQLLQAK